MGVIPMTELKGLEDIGKLLNIMRSLECTKIEILKDEVETVNGIENVVVSVRFTMQNEVIVFNASAQESKLIKEKNL